MALEPTWPGLEPLGHELLPGHEADRGGQRRRAGRELHERGEHVLVQRARVNLPDAGEDLGETQVLGDPALELGELPGVPAEQAEHVLGGADRALDPAQRVAGDQLRDPAVRHQRLVGGRGEALAERRGLRGDVVAAPGHDQLGVLAGAAREAGEDRDGLLGDEAQRVPDLQLLDVLGEVAAGHALVRVLVPGERVELLDARLDVVARDPLAGGDRGEVDVVDHGAVVVEDTVGDVDPELGLRGEHRDPQLALEGDLALGRPQRRQRGRGVPPGEHVRDHRCTHVAEPTAPVGARAAPAVGPVSPTATVSLGRDRGGGAHGAGGAGRFRPVAGAARRGR